MPVTAEDVAAAWLRVERSERAGISADRIRARRATAKKLTRLWGTEERKRRDGELSTHHEVVGVDNFCNVNEPETAQISA